MIKKVYFFLLSAIILFTSQLPYRQYQYNAYTSEPLSGVTFIFKINENTACFYKTEHMAKCVCKIVKDDWIYLTNENLYILHKYGKCKIKKINEFSVSNVFFLDETKKLVSLQAFLLSRKLSEGYVLFTYNSMIRKHLKKIIKKDKTYPLYLKGGEGVCLLKSGPYLLQFNFFDLKILELPKYTELVKIKVNNKGIGWINIKKLKIVGRNGKLYEDKNEK